MGEAINSFERMDKAKFYLNSRGSLYELKSHLLLARELGFGSGEDYKEAMETIERFSVQLNNLISSTRGRARGIRRDA